MTRVRARGFPVLAALLCWLSLASDLGAGQDPSKADRAAPASSMPAGIHLEEVSIGGGYARGSLKGAGPLVVDPGFIRFGFDVGEWIKLNGPANTLQLAFEPFANRITTPRPRVEIGVDLFFRYVRVLTGPVAVFGEAGAGPLYFDLDTVEQGHAGFNFLDQLGGGVRIKVSAREAVFAGYRCRHVSHAGLSQRPNRGVDTQSIIVGFSWLY
jgi:lipid A 3-O-deacylase